MTLLVRRSQTSDTDETLTVLAREGDDDAFAELYRRHLAAAKSTARYMARSRDDAEDIVAEAFTGVLSALRHGRGPTDNFRAYLLACVRNGCYVRRKPALAIGDEELEAASPPSLEDPEKYIEADTVARAFASLSPRWQRTLWLTEVEQRPATEVGEQMQLAPNATAALSRRARQAFAAAYLSQHVANLAGLGCGPIAPRLGSYVRNTLRPNERAEVAEHLLVCASCSRAVDELSDLNASLRTLQAPIAVIGAGAAAVGTGMAVSSTGGVGGTWAALLSAGALAKVAAAVLIVVPAVAFGINRATESTPHKDLTPATVIAPPTGTVGRDGAVTSVSTAVPPNGATGAQPSDATSAASADVSTTGVDGLPVTVPPSTVVPDAGGAVAVPGSAVGAAAGGGGVAPAAPSSGGAGGGTVTVPPATVPRVTVPGVTVPAVTIPGASVPPVGVPPVVVPPVQVPVITVPPIVVPGLTTIALPPVVLPPVVVPTVAVPPVTLPPVTVPVTVPVTLPPVTVPVTLPPVTLPPVTVPPVTATVPPIVPGLGRAG